MKRVHAKKQNEIILPDRFVPEFWKDQDHRNAVVRAIRDRYEDLKRDCGADSMQKDMLCQRAVFVALQLEWFEIKAVNTGKIDCGRYTQLVNCLTGLLRSLGLERKVKTVENLADYVKKNKKKKGA